MTDAILAINAGSSSIKFALFSVSEDLRCLDQGKITQIDQLPIYQSGQQESPLPLHFCKKEKHVLVEWLITRLKTEHAQYNIVAIGHRVVHGGPDFSTAQLVTPDLEAQLNNYVPLAPQHQPVNLAAIKMAARQWPDAIQVASFDTAFHRSQTQLAQTFSLPLKYREEGVIRYGFHGLSYQYIASQLPEYLGEQAKGRIIVMHLGHGCSLCALKEGKSQATTMGLTAFGGVMMGKRCGDLDPGVVLYLMREKNMDHKELATLLGQHSGLLGVSGVSSDMQELLASDEKQAAFAIDLFVYQIVKAVGSMASAIEGVDALVFTGGIGENSAPIRQMIGNKLSWIGVQIDSARNSGNNINIESSESSLPVLVIKTDEERVIAEQTKQFLRQKAEAII